MSSTAAASAVPRMPYRFMGRSGLLVSALSFGSWTTFDSQLNIDAAYELMARAFRRGVNFFDNAEAYAEGKSEAVMGACVARGIERGVWAREDLVITTKIFFSAKVTSGPNDQGLSRKHVVEGTKASLKRFGLDYVDVLLCHRPDPRTPIEETVRAMNFVINQGWALYWGTSEWSAQDVIEACEIADRLGLIQPVCDQPQYNLLERSRVEFEYDVLYKKYGYGLTTWSPLASGVLTGKYSKGVVPKGSRMELPRISAMYGATLAETADKVDQLGEIAKEIGCTTGQLAIAWCASNPHVSTVLLGAKSAEQLDANLDAIAFVEKITPEVRAKIDKIIDFRAKQLPRVPAYVQATREKWL